MHKNTQLIIIFTLLAMFPPFASDMYLPAFQNIETTFNVNFHAVQLTLSIFMIGYAVSQLIFGPISDRYGRKPVLLSGIALFIIFSLACVFANNIHSFYIARLLQAIGAGSGAVLSFAIIKDLYQHEERIHYIGIISALMGLAPIIAPTIGGYITVQFGWRVIFLFLTLLGLLSFVGVLTISESLPNKSKINIKILTENYLALFKNPKFMRAVISCAFAFAAMFAFIASSSKIYIQVFGIPQNKFGYYFAINALAFMVGNFISAKYSKLISSKFLNRWGAFIIVIGGLLLLISSILSFSINPIVITMLIATLGVGMVIPASIANAMSHIQHYAGQASSLIAFFQFGMAAVISLVVGHIQFVNAVPLGVLVLACGLLSTMMTLDRAR